MFNIKRFLFGIPLEERPDVPCNNKKKHYGYIDMNLSCPNCMFKNIAKDKMEQSIKDEQLRIKHQEELAELIANKIVEKLGECSLFHSI